MLTMLSLFLAGCTEFNEPIYENSEGFWNEYIVWPLVSLITLFKELLGTYGYGIIAVTIIIRLSLITINDQTNTKLEKNARVATRTKCLKRKI